MAPFFFDQRWCLPHGIGRFASELHRRLRGFEDLDLQGSHVAPLDAFRLAAYLKRTKARGYFSPGYNVPAFANCHSISTIHDLIHLQFPGKRSLLKSLYYRTLQRRVIRQSPVVLTVSQYSRGEIVDWYDIEESKVICVGNGVSEAFTPNGPTHHSDRPYFLYVGNLKPHKNIDVLMEAMQRLSTTRDAELKMLLPTVTDSFRTSVAERGLTERVQFLANLSDEDLASFYRGAVALVLPSLFEGFGLPLVEAMACGCPVIGSECTSIPEVMGEAGERFDPRSAPSLEEKMRLLVDSPSHRETMISRGFSQAAKFTWNQVASRVQDAVAPYLS